MTAVADASPVIALAQIGHLDLFFALYGTLLIPPAVQSETSRALGAAGGSPSWVVVQAARNTALVAQLRLVMDAGEAEALALARELTLPIIVDEIRARAEAVRMGLEVVGAIGVIVSAKSAGIIAEVRPVLEALRASGFWMSPALFETALVAAGEG